MTPSTLPISSLASLLILIFTLGLLSPLIAASPAPAATLTPPVPSTTVTSADSTITLFSTSPSLQFQEKYHLTTYYACVTWPDNSVYCGTHEPVLDGGTDIIGRAGARATAKAVAAIGAAVGAVVVAAL